MKKLPLAALFGTAAVCLSVSPLLLAEDVTPLDEIVVTADRKARTVDETLTPVTVITRQDIEKYQASDLPDVLRHVPGINVKNDGGMGQTTSVFIRGTNSSHVLVLIDGVKMGSATAGTIPFEHIPLNQVERIEVVRGPRSSLYGSEAIGGVIQIFTRKGGKGFQPEISLSAGSNATQAANLNLAGGNETTWFNLNTGSEKTAGINVLESYIDYPPPAFAPTVVRETDLDGYRRESAALRTGHRFANGTEIELAALQAQGNSHYDGSLVNQADFLQQTSSGKLKYKLGDKAVITAQIGQSQDEADNFKDGIFTSRFDTKRNTASVQTDIQVGQSSGLTLGVDQQTDKIKTTTPYDRTSRKNTGAFASYQQDFGKTQMELSARQDDNEQFGKHQTGALAVGHDLTAGMRLKASYGTAFKAPTMNDLYYPDDGYGVGNAKLKSESSQNVEAGLQGKGQKGSWEVNLFQNQVDNLIDWAPVDPADPFGKWTPSNINKARIQGIEASAKTQLAGWDASANLTLQKPENRVGVDAGKILTYRPEQLASVDLDRRFGNVGLGASLRGEGQRYTSTDNSEKLPGYATLDLRTDYKLSKDWTAGLKIGNVLDKDYQTNKGYNQDGVNGLVTVKYAPK